jgi:O-antigen/teichoic acid export membrane protein
MDFLMSSTCNVMMVNMRERMLAGDHEQVVAIWLDSIRKLALIFFPLVTVLLITADLLIVLLFTSTYERSIPIFMVWTIAMLFATLLTDGVLRVYAETRFLIVQNLIRLAVIAVCIKWFLVNFDLIGAILVTLLATVVSKCVALYRIRTVMGVTLRQLLPWTSLLKTLLIAACAAPPALLVKTLLGAPDPLLIMITGGVYTLAYYVLLQSFGPMQHDEKKMLSQWVQIPFIRLGRVLRIQSVSD